MITKSQITTIKSLKEKNNRTQLSLFVAEGEKMFDEILNSEFFVKQLFFVSSEITKSTLQKINTLSKKNSCEIFEVSSSEMSRITYLKSSTPILMCVEIPKYDFYYKEGSLILALDNVQDPGNMGTIIRIADWFGISDVICSPTSADVYNPKVIQATMGAITRVRVHYLPLKETLMKLRVPVYGTFLDGENIYNKKLSMKSGVIVMGNEGNGISDEIASLVGERLFIPPFPLGAQTSESLNVAVATSIICSEFRRG